MTKQPTVLSDCSHHALLIEEPYSPAWGDVYTNADGSMTLHVRQPRILRPGTLMLVAPHERK